MRKWVMVVWLALGVAPWMAMVAGAVEFPKVESFNPSWPSAAPGMSSSVNLPTSALLGNGSLGAVNGGDANHKLFVLTRGDFWSCGDLSTGYRANNVRALSFADFEIGPGMASVTGTDTLDIGCGVLRTEGGFGKGSVKMESWVDANEDLFVVRGVSTADGEWAVHLVAHGNPDEFPVTVKASEDGFWVRRTSVDLTKGDPRGWTTNVTAALSTVGAALADIKIENRTHVWAWAKVRAGQPFAFVVAADPRRRFTWAELDAKRAAHDRWWREWWSLNDIALGDAELERFYYGSLYLMGAGLRQGKQAVGLYGIWPTTDKPSWHNDIHLNYNFIATYYGCWAANRCGVADTAADPLLAYLPQAERNAREGLKNLVRCKGHHYPNTEAYLKRRVDLADGIPDAAHFPVALSPYGVSAEGDDSHWSQISDGVFQCAAYCTHWEYTRDREYLKHVWPLLDKTANFFLTWCEKESRPDGSYRYLVYDSHWEGSGLVKNSAPALGCLRHLLEVLVAAAPELRAAGIELAEAKVAAWKDLLDHLSDYPVGVRKVGDREVKMLSGVERDDGVADIALGCNAVTLEGLHPGEWAAFDMTDEFRTLATNCVNAMIQLGGEKRVWKGGNQTPKLCIQAIRMGYPCQAVIDAFKKWEIRGNGQKNFHLRDNVHGVEKIGAIEFVNSMLLQSDHGFVKVFPNWTGKDAKFRDLRAKGAFLVSAEMKGGQVEAVTVKSLKGGTFRLVNPWPGKEFENCRVGSTRNSREPTLEFDLKAGEVRVLQPGAPGAGAAGAAEEVLAQMTFDFGSMGGIYATGDAKARLVAGGSHAGSRGMLEVYQRTEKWNAGEFNLTGRVEDGATYRFAANVRQDSVPEGMFQLSLKIVDETGTHYELVARATGKMGAWTPIAGTYTLGKGVKALYPYVELYSGTEPFFVDDLVFARPNAPARDVALEADLAPLKDAFRAAGLVCGASVGDAVLGDPTGLQKQLLARHFDALAPENQLKAQFLLDHGASVADLAKHADDAALDFSAPKPWFDFAQAHGMRVNAQALVWHLLTPEWWFHENYDVKAPLASRERMLRRLDNYIRRVLAWCETNYPGLVRSWVVVNEAVDGDAKPFLRDTLFLKTIGEDYVAEAFKIAAKYRPKSDCVYLYNDYNMEYYYEKMDFVLAYLKKYDLIAQKCVDGIGFQCHFKMDWPGPAEIRKNCARVAAAGLMADVTELDVRFDRSAVARFPTPADAWAKQAARYREIAGAFRQAKADGLDLRGFGWWGLTDAYTWLTDFHGEANYPLLFDRNNKHKPAFDAVKDAIRP